MTNPAPLIEDDEDDEDAAEAQALAAAIAESDADPRTKRSVPGCCVSPMASLTPRRLSHAERCRSMRLGQDPGTV
jgi:hypothetical protein